ncbi:MAG: futalosine hydrolase [Fibrobacterota bacterium]|nr:futalosine hydrolase [Fibrobacterota bacterium]QQS03110.1 MAG: futalosine hydrolase [Fibrobacterota bacterium]
MTDPRTLWVAATAREAAVVPGHARVLVTGVGAARAALELGLALRVESFDRVVGIGIAGAYPSAGLSLGQVVALEEDAFLDLGAEDGEQVLDLWSLGFDPGYPSRFPLLVPPWARSLAVVRGGTCAVCTGSESTQKQREAAGFQVESMEGAGWAMACWRLGVPFAQVRSISNIAGPRDRGAWKMDAALAALANIVEEACRT